MAAVKATVVRRRILPCCNCVMMGSSRLAEGVMLGKKDKKEQHRAAEARESEDEESDDEARY